MQLVVSATPGTGKSTITKNAEQYGLNHCHVHYDNHTREYELTVPNSPLVPVFDSDSSHFDKSEFPGNYIKHIKEVLSKFPNVVIFVSSHDVVREAMAEAGIKYVLVYPERELKGDYLERYKERGSPEKFIELMDNKWNDFIDSVQADEAERHLVLSEGEFLVDVIKSDIENVTTSKVDSIFPTAIITGMESIGDIVCDDVGQPVAAWGANGLEPIPDLPPAADVIVNSDASPENPEFATAIISGTESVGDTVYNDVGAPVAIFGETGLQALPVIEGEVIPAEVIVDVNAVPVEEPPAAMIPQDTPVPVDNIPEQMQSPDPVPPVTGQPAVDAPTVDGQENLLAGSEKGDEVLPGAAPAPVSTELNKMDDVDLKQNQAIIGRDIGNAGNADEHPNVDGNENLITANAEDGAEVLPGPAESPVPAALKAMETEQLNQNLHEVEADIGTLSKALEDRQDPERAGLEGLNSDASTFGPACADLKKRYGVEVEASIGGLEGFLDQLKNMATVIKRAISDPKADQAKVKKALWEVSAAIKAYNSPAWINKQQWINVGKVNVQVPGFLKDINSPEDVETALKLAIGRVVDASAKFCKNDISRVKAAKKIHADTKAWDSAEKTAADLKSLVDTIPDALTGPIEAAGLDSLDTSMSGVELPVIPKTAVGKITALMEMLTKASSDMFKHEDSIPEVFSYEQYAKNKFLVKHNSSEIYNLISSEAEEPGCAKIGTAYYKKFVPVAQFLEMWLLRSTK